MKHKTAELTGALLDAAVALAEGRNVRLGQSRIYVSSPGGFDTCEEGFAPSTAWQIGGPIIEREGIELYCRRHGSNQRAGEWCARAFSYPPMTSLLHFGPTPLTAAMRAFVASKLGEEVELP